MNLEGFKLGNVLTLTEDTEFLYGEGLVKKKTWPKGTKMEYMLQSKYMLGKTNYARFYGPDKVLYWIAYSGK